MNNRNAPERNQPATFPAPGGTVRNPVSTGPVPTQGGRLRVGYGAGPTVGGNSLTGPIKYSRPKATPETISIGGGPKIGATPAAAEPPLRIRRSMAGTFTTRKPPERIAKRPSAAAGPSNAMRRGPPSLQFRQSHTHTYTRQGKGLPSIAHKIPHGKHGHTRKPTGSSMNVILPPQNIHSLTGSVMESQMFPRAAALQNTARHSEYSTFRVEIQQNSVPSVFASLEQEGKYASTIQSPLLTDEKDVPPVEQCYFTSMSAPEKFKSSISYHDEMSILNSYPSSDEKLVLPKNNNEKKAANVIPIVNDDEVQIPVPVITIVNDEVKIPASVIPVVNDEEIKIPAPVIPIVNDEEVQIPASVIPILHNDKVLKPAFPGQTKFETDMDKVSNFFGNLMRTDYVIPPSCKVPQTAPPAPISTTLSCKSCRSIHQKQKVEKKESKRSGCLESLSQTILTEIDFLHGLKSDSLENFRDSLPPKPKTAQPLLSIVTETEFLKAALHDLSNTSEGSLLSKLQSNLSDSKSKSRTHVRNRSKFHQKTLL